MPIVDGIVQRAIGWPEMASFLGEPCDEGMICRSDKINMWAKNKPIEVTGKIGFDSVEEYNRYASNSEITYGIRFIRTSYANIPSLYDGELNGWHYEKPTTWNRIGDFEGYDHNAIKPFVSIDLDSDTVDKKVGDTSSDHSAHLVIHLASATDNHFDTSVSLNDLGLGNYYLGLVVAGGGNTSIAVGDTQIKNIISNDGEGVFSVPMNDYPNGLYSIYPAAFENSEGGNVVLLPYAQKAIIKVIDTTVGDGSTDGSANYDIDISWNETKTSVICYISISNETSTSYKDVDVTFRLYRRSREGDDLIGSATERFDIGTKETKWFTKNIIAGYDKDYEYYVTVNFSKVFASDDYKYEVLL